jgi:hypothetical protein
MRVASYAALVPTRDRFAASRRSPCIACDPFDARNAASRSGAIVCWWRFRLARWRRRFDTSLKWFMISQESAAVVARKQAKRAGSVFNTNASYHSVL